MFYVCYDIIYTVASSLLPHPLSPGDGPVFYHTPINTFAEATYQHKSCSDPLHPCTHPYMSTTACIRQQAVVGSEPSDIMVFTKLHDPLRHYITGWQVLAIPGKTTGKN